MWCLPTVGIIKFKPLTQIHDRSQFWVGTGTSINNDGVKLVSGPQSLKNSDKLDKIFPSVDFYSTMYSYKAQMVKINPLPPFLSPFNVQLSIRMSE